MNASVVTAAPRPNVVAVAAKCPCGSTLAVTTTDGVMADLQAVTDWLDRHADPHPRAWGREVSGAT